MPAQCATCCCRFAGESFLTGASSTQLSTKLLSLLQDCICTHTLPELQRRLEKLKAAVTPPARMLLKKGRRYEGAGVATSRYILLLTGTGVMHSPC